MKELNKDEIEILYNEIKQEYIQKSKFKDYSVEDIIIKSLNVLDFIFISCFDNILNEKQENFLKASRENCREFIKLFSNNKHNHIISVMTDQDMIDIFQEFKNLTYYNIFRNKLEKGYVGNCIISYDEDLKTIKCSNDMNEKEILAREIDVIKPSFNLKTYYKNTSANKILSFLTNKYSDIPLININNYTNHMKEICNLYNFMLDEYEDDCSIENKYKFKDFTLDEFKKIYSALMVLAYNQIDKLKNNKIQEIPLWEKSDLINFIKDISKLKVDTIIFILDKLLIYDSDFHKELLTFYQSIFQINNKILISGFLTLIGYAQDKLICLLNKKTKTKSLDNSYEKVLSSIANDKEYIMLEECNQILQSNKYELKQNVKYSIKQNKNTDAEFDIVLFDKIKSNLLLIELKDLLKGDNEIEQYRIEKKLDEFCLSRKDKQKIVEDNINDFIKRTFNFNLKAPLNVESLLVSKNFIGISENHKITIVNELILNDLFNSCNKDTDEIFKKLRNKEIYITTNNKNIISKNAIVNFLDYTIETKQLFIK